MFIADYAIRARVLKTIEEARDDVEEDGTGDETVQEPAATDSPDTDVDSDDAERGGRGVSRNATTATTEAVAVDIEMMAKIPTTNPMHVHSKRNPSVAPRLRKRDVEERMEELDSLLAEDRKKTSEDRKNSKLAAEQMKMINDKLSFFLDNFCASPTVGSSSSSGGGGGSGGDDEEMGDEVGGVETSHKSREKKGEKRFSSKIFSGLFSSQSITTNKTTAEGVDGESKTAATAAGSSSSTTQKRPSTLVQLQGGFFHFENPLTSTRRGSAIINNTKNNNKPKQNKQQEEGTENFYL